MNVKELIEKLQSCNPDALVICSSDNEGNSSSPLDSISESGYEAEDDSYGTVGLLALTPELKASGYTKHDILLNGIPALVLYPIQ